MNPFELLGRKEVEIADLKQQNKNLVQIISQIKNRTLSLEELDALVTIMPVAQEQQANSVVPEEDSIGSSNNPDP